MQLTPELIAGLLAAFIALCGILFFRARAKRSRRVERPLARGPSNLRYECAGCSAQFSHSRRTLGAWETGTRRFFCNACHAKWRNSQPPAVVPGKFSSNAGDSNAAGRHAEQRPVTQASASNQHHANRPVHASSRGGCLGAAVLLIAVPIAVVFVAAQYV